MTYPGVITYWTPDQLSPTERALWDTHMINSRRSEAFEAAAEHIDRYDTTYERWQRECAADGVDPEIERAYYEIDKLKALADQAVSTGTIRPRA
jgi:molybdopterin synthase catalytic subunit